MIDELGSSGLLDWGKMYADAISILDSAVFYFQKKTKNELNYFRIMFTPQYEYSIEFGICNGDFDMDMGIFRVKSEFKSISIDNVLKLVERETRLCLNQMPA